MNNQPLTDSNEVSVYVWAHRNDEFMAKMEKINRRILKKGIFGQVAWELASKKMLNISKNPDKEVLAEMFTYTIKYPKLALPGDWELLGEITEGTRIDGKIFNFVNGYGDLAKYTSKDLCECDHCHINRHRVHSMILRSKVDGTEVVVGSSCLKDFLGHDPEAAVYMLQFLSSFEGFGRADDVTEKYTFISLQLATELVLYSVKHAGWHFMPRAKARDLGCAATADVVCEVYNDLSTRGTPVYPDFRDAIYTDFFKATVPKILEQAQALADNLGESELSDFDQKIAIMANRGCVDLSTSFQISIYTAWAAKKILEIVNPERTSKVASEHFGSVGEKLIITVIPDRHNTHDGDYGTVHIISGVVSGTSNRWTWFGTGAAVWRLVDENGIVISDEFVISATVKKHEDNKFGKTTVLTRVKVI